MLVCVCVCVVNYDPPHINVLKDLIHCRLNRIYFIQGYNCIIRLALFHDFFDMHDHVVISQHSSLSAMHSWVQSST